MVTVKHYNIYEDGQEQVRAAAKLALKHRLFVNGWCLRDVLHLAVKNPDEITKISFVMDSEVPIGVSVQDYMGQVQVFVRKPRRRQGYGSLLMSNMDNIGTYAGTGVDRQNRFWKKHGIRVLG